MERFDRGALPFETAFISMRDLEQVFSPIAQPWVRYRVRYNTIQVQSDELRRGCPNDPTWRNIREIGVSQLMGSWVEVS